MFPAWKTSQDPSGYLGYAEDSAEQRRLLMWQKDVARVNSERLNVIRKYDMRHPEPWNAADAMNLRSDVSIQALETPKPF